ncbi:MAG TPA: MarR family transcriptional regulator [Mycobacteriales bacterium]|jgi:Transcriptional regulators
MSRSLNLPFDPVARAAELWARRWGDEAVDAMAAVTSLMRAQQILLGELDAVLRPHRLTFARYEALVLLSFAREGGLPLSKIGERLMVHPTSVTNTIDRLEAAGLVVRGPNPRDRRGVLASITPDGRELVERATRDLTQARFGMGSLSAGDLKALFDVLVRLRVDAGDFTPRSTDSRTS